MIKLFDIAGRFIILFLLFSINVNAENICIDSDFKIPMQTDSFTYRYKRDNKLYRLYLPGLNSINMISEWQVPDNTEMLLVDGDSFVVSIMELKLGNSSKYLLQKKFGVSGLLDLLKLYPRVACKRISNYLKNNYSFEKFEDSMVDLFIYRNLIVIDNRLGGILIIAPHEKRYLRAQIMLNDESNRFVIENFFRPKI